MSGIISGIVLFVAMVLICRGRSEWENKHPQKCDICGADVPAVISLKDGCMCYKCTEAKYGYKTIELTEIMKKLDFKKYTVEEMKNYIGTIKQRGELMASFRPTRVSETGHIQVDDNLHLFIINDAGPIDNVYAHDPTDIQSFRLVIDKKSLMPGETSTIIEGGHIEIKLKEPANKIGVYYLSKRDSIGAKHEIKKALEPDFKFLEEITGLKRSIMN